MPTASESLVLDTVIVPRSSPIMLSEPSANVYVNSGLAAPYTLLASCALIVTFLGLITTIAVSVSIYFFPPTSTVIWTLTLYVPTLVNDGAVSLQSSSPSATVLIPSSLEDVVTSWYLMDSTEINSLAWSTYTGSKPVPSLSV